MNSRTINRQMTRIDAIFGGAVIFGADFEGYIPLLIAIAAGLIIGFILRSLFTSIVEQTAKQGLPVYML